MEQPPDLRYVVLGFNSVTKSPKNNSIYKTSLGCVPFVFTCILPFILSFQPSEEDIEIYKHGSVNLPADINDLMQAFPFGLKNCPYNRSIFRPYLPTKTRALELASIYYRSVAWMYVFTPSYIQY